MYIGTIDAVKTQERKCLTSSKLPGAWDDHVTRDSRQTSNVQDHALLAYSLPIPSYGRPVEQGRPLYFCLVVSSFFLSFFLSFFFPRQISAVGDWMTTIHPHMVWP